MAVRSPGRRPARPGPRPQSASRHHADWLNLVEQSGPFLGLTELLRVFPAGLDADDSDLRRDLRAAYSEWRDSQGGVTPDPEMHTLWVRWVLRQVLGLEEWLLLTGQAVPPPLTVAVPEQGEHLQPTAVLTTPPGRPDAARPRLLIGVEPAGRELFDPIPDRRWTASPAARMALLLQGTGVRLGLVTNGERWVLVNAAPGETVGYASWYASLWLDEPITLQAFRSLLGQSRFFGVPDGDTLEKMLEASASDQVEVTDQLGLQVRTAVEVLVRALDRADLDRHRELLAGLAAREVYHAGLTVMMRLVFLMSAEERGLFLLGDDLYDQHYAVSTLRAQLREAADSQGEDVLERRFDAWARLLATFRAVYGGVEHEALRLPAYGGDLFDPDRFPFLEGRLAGTSWQTSPARPLPISNRTVLHLLEALQLLQVRVPGGVETRRLSFRALDVEQIGHVYEGLLDHTARRAERPLLQLQAAAGRKGRGGEPILAVDELEAAAAQGQTALVTLVKERTGRTESAVANALKPSQTPLLDGPILARLLQACGNDPALRDRVLPYLGLLATTDDGYPAVVLPGGLYVGAGADRRGSGTHYTPRSLTEPIVRYALEPLVYHGPAEGAPAERWTLRTPRELLDLKVCDPAMGSGAFLVQACRYLSERLAESWEAAEKALGVSPAPQITPYGEPSTGGQGDQPIPREPTERLALARRLVADRCLYGVDKNPTAVEMARLSLWLTTLDKDRPFTFLDHALKSGDSLVGVADLEQVRRLHPKPATSSYSYALTADLTDAAVGEAVALREALERMPTVSIADVQRKAGLLAQAEQRMATAFLLGDLVTGTAIATAGRGERRLNEQLGLLTPVVLDALESPDLVGAGLAPRPDRDAEDPLATLKDRATSLLLPCLGGDDPERGPAPTPFHWPLEFPEVFGRPNGGFDAVVGNPPFMGGKKITGELGDEYRNYLVDALAGGVRGHADLAAYFVLRVAGLLRVGGSFGLITTNTIAQGDTREVGLDQLVRDGFVIMRAIPSRKWPGEANLEVAQLWVGRGPWRGEHTLDDKPVSAISPFLTPPGKVSGPPKRLLANEGKSFIGSYVLGLGFTMSPEDAQALIARDPRNAEVLFPYLNGEDLNSRWDQSPSRWVINFFDRSEQESRTYSDCWQIVQERVRPERQRVNDDGDYVLRRPLPQRFWQYADKRPALYEATLEANRVLVASIVTHYVSLAFVPATWVYAHRLAVFVLDRWAHMAVLQSNLHEIWARAYSSSLETRLNYSPSDCFLTFPFPESIDSLEEIGERYYTHRQSIMTARQEGLTKTYNRVHNPQEHAPDIERLRELRVEMDNAVAAAYGWSDLALEHGFHQTAQGVRFTLSKAARDEVHDRLLILNHQRYDEEVAAGLHKDAKGKRVKGSPSPPDPLSRTRERGRPAGTRGQKQSAAEQTQLSLLGEEPSG